MQWKEWSREIVPLANTALCAHRNMTCNFISYIRTLIAVSYAVYNNDRANYMSHDMHIDCLILSASALK